MDEAYGPYRKIDVCLWTDEKVRRLTPMLPSGVGLWVYLLTNHNTTSVPGLYRVGYSQLWRDELRWPEERFVEAFAELAAEGMAASDWTHGVVWIPKAIKYDPPANPNVVRGWRRHLRGVPECALKQVAIAALREALADRRRFKSAGFSRAFDEATGGAPQPPKGSPNGSAKGLPKGLPKGSGNGSGKGLAEGSPNGSANPSPNRLANQEQEQEQEQEQDQEQKEISSARAPAALDYVGIAEPANSQEARAVESETEPDTSALREPPPPPKPPRLTQRQRDQRDQDRSAFAIRAFQGPLPNIATHDVEVWREDWDWIARRPTAERAMVIKTLAASAWATRHWRACDPRHIRRYWQRYAAGEEPGRFEPGPDARGYANGRRAGPSAIASVEEYEADRGEWTAPVSDPEG